MKLVLFGCGLNGNEAFNYFGESKIAYFCDNDNAQWGKDFNNKKILSPNELAKIADNYLIVITPALNKATNIEKQLISYNIKHYIMWNEIKNNDQLRSLSVEKVIKLCYDSDFICKGIRQHYLDINKQLVSENIYFKTHLNIRNFSVGEESYSRDKQLKIIEFCNEFFDKVKSIKIKPILAGGNLIGYVRNNGFIPWDDDIDFMLFREDYEKLIEWCNNNIHVFRYGEENNFVAWEDRLLHEYPNEYILLIHFYQIKIVKGTNMMNERNIDFFSLDYFSNQYSFSEHTNYLHKLLNKINNCQNNIDKMKIMDYEKSNFKFFEKESNNIYYGLDNMSYINPLRKSSNWNSWFHKDDIFPLKLVNYEGMQALIPNKPENLLPCDYGDYMEWPEKLGIGSHGNTKYLQDKYLNVEIYLTDTESIDYLLPLYNLMRKNEIYTVFVAEPTYQNIVGNNFKFNKALQVLNKYKLEYSTSCNYNADCVFTNCDRIFSKYSFKTTKIYHQYDDQQNCKLDSYNINGYNYKYYYCDNFKIPKNSEIIIPTIIKACV